jgi:hypothetical protein
VRSGTSSQAVLSRRIRADGAVVFEAFDLPEQISFDEFRWAR